VHDVFCHASGLSAEPWSAAAKLPPWLGAKRELQATEDVQDISDGHWGMALRASSARAVLGEKPRHKLGFGIGSIPRVVSDTRVLCVFHVASGCC
jgi:hypothetical protein